MRAPSLQLVVQLQVGLLIVLVTCVDCIVFEEVQSLNVWLTISSLANKDPANKSNTQFRQIELNWINAPLNDDSDYIALYLDAEPDADGDTRPVSIYHPTSISGKQLVADHHLPVIDFYNETHSLDRDKDPFRISPREISREDWRQERRRMQPTTSGQASSLDAANRWNQHKPYAMPMVGLQQTGGRQRDNSGPEYRLDQPLESGHSILADECVGYCVAYFSQRKMLAKSCLGTRPNWMRDSQIGSRSPAMIAIPGTHNSGTYLKQRPGSYRIDKSVLQLINKYQLNQEESIFNQLVWGIRYLDLRVGLSRVKQRSEELWIYHDIFRTDNSLDEVLKQIKRFLDLARHEIVIVDFHRFTVGFQNEEPNVELERHGRVLDLLYTTLGDYIVPSYLGQNAPLNEYISLNKRLFVGYAGRSRLLNLRPAEDGSRYYPLQLGYQLGSSGPAQPVRDIDADKQDRDVAVNWTFPNANSVQVDHLAPISEGPPDQETLDRRIGTRVYNRLKSLKVISHSFSKRSVELEQDQDGQSGEMSGSRAPKRGNIYKAKSDHASSTSPIGPPNPHRTSMKMVSQVAVSAQSLNSRLALLFNPVHHVWPNTDKEEALRQFIEQSACRRYLGEFNSLMAELTPTVFGAISDKYDGIRRLSSLTNRMVGDLIRSKFLHCINLIATDYFLGNDLIRLAIHANRMRQHHRNSDLDPLQGDCKSFRRVGPLLERSKALETNTIQSSSSSPSSTSGTSSLYQVDSLSDFISSLFKRLFNR